MSTPLENFTKIYDDLSLYARMCGITLFHRPNRSPNNWITTMWIGFLFTLLASWLYTCCVADNSVRWRSSAAVLVAVQGLTKFHVHTTYMRRIIDKLSFVRRIYELNQDGNTVNYWLLRKWSARINFVIGFGWMPIMATGSLFFAMPAWTYWRHGERELMLEFWLPGIDHQSSTIGYVVHCVYHCATITLAIAGSCGADLMMVCLILHVCPMTEIWAAQWRRLDAALAEPALRRSPERRAYFRLMLHVHRDLSLYLRDLSQIYWSMTFCEVFTCSGILCIILYCYLVLSWAQAPILGGLFFGTLLLFCALGTLIEVATDRVYEATMLNRWYWLECEEQRVLVAVLADAQRPALLMAGTMPLNMMTCVESLKTVYSVGMLLVQ